MFLRPFKVSLPANNPASRIASSCQIITTSTPRPSSIQHRAMATKTAPGEQFEVRQTSSTDDWHPDPSKSIPLSPARQALLDDILALYSCEPTIERVKRYTPDCVYDDQFVYANDRYVNIRISSCFLTVRSYLSLL